MANDWIKMRTDLYRDPKVIVMADSMLNPEGELAAFVGHNCRRNMTVTRNVTRNACVGALLSVWGVMRHRGVRVGDDLQCHGITLAVVDDIADLPGFGKAMEHVGWVESTDSGLVFPRFFADYNVEPDEKNKSKNAERQARYREKLKANSNVTSNVTRNVTVTPREEKRREEKSLNTPLIPQGGEAVAEVDPPQKPKRKPKAATVGEWSIPHGWDSEKLREALGAFERMRESIGKRIKDRANASMHFKSFDNADHLIYALEFAVANEYQGIKPDYRPQQQSKPEPKQEKELPMITELPPYIVEIYKRKAEERRKRDEEFERTGHNGSV